MPPSTPVVGRRQMGGLVRIGPPPAGSQQAGQVLPPTRVDGGKPSRLELMIGLTLQGYTRGHPCNGARSVAGTGRFFYAVYQDMRNVDTALAVLRDLDEYFAITDPGDPVVKTCALVFADHVSSELDFGHKYWAFAQTLHDVDCQRDDYPAHISTDPTANSFEFCLAGRPIFTTTLHPVQTRPARQAQFPTWVMNQTSQFDALRAASDTTTGQSMFEAWQKMIRKNDAALDPTGQPNPILVNHGYGSAATQLPGIDISPCPFSPRTTRPQREAALAALVARAQAEHADQTYLDDLEKRRTAGRQRRGEV